ncbi:MAG: hypothetical protein OXL97_14945 [Chloroflexota bacterium]|nr:hypothetical protein [Chloroflexota bacterium]MDE2884411.1 hypothetical protein [Chloroflexota bacterium]
MRRFLATYRWELWLLLWAPLLGWVVTSTALELSAYLDGRLWLRTRVYPHWAGAAGSLVQAGLLLMFYARVRQLERPFLTLVWRYAFLLEAVRVLFSLLVSVLSLAVGDLSVSGLVALSTGITLVRFTVTLPLLLWFARRASRFSLAHAFFLFLVTEPYGWGDILFPLAFDLVPHAQLSLVLTSISLALILLVGLPLAWLLGNYESRSDAFRRRAVGVLLAVYAVPHLWRAVETVISVIGQDDGMIGTLALASLVLLLTPVVVILPFALIYLVRVRKPAAEQQA